MGSSVWGTWDGLENVLSLMLFWCHPLETDSCLDANHYDDVIMSAIASQITSLTIVYSAVYPGADQSKYQSSASLAFVWGIHRGPVNSPHKWPVMRKMFPFDDVIMFVITGGTVRYTQCSLCVSLWFHKSRFSSCSSWWPHRHRAIIMSKHQRSNQEDCG